MFAIQLYRNWSTDIPAMLLKAPVFYSLVEFVCHMLQLHMRPAFIFLEQLKKPSTHFGDLICIFIFRKMFENIPV